MLDRLRHLLLIWRWDFIIVWRSCNGRWYIFRDAPLIIVARFAKADAEFFERKNLPEAVNAIHQARAEMALREQVLLRQVLELKAKLNAELERIGARREDHHA